VGEHAWTKRPKDIIQITKTRKSTGQWTKVPENGNSHRIARSIDIAATHSV
jgi:hypothetical protein